MRPFLLLFLLTLSGLSDAQDDHLGKWKYEGLIRSSIDTLYIAPEDVDLYMKNLENKFSAIKIFFVNDSIVDYQIDQLVEEQIYTRDDGFIILVDVWEFEMLSPQSARLDFDNGSIYMSKYENLAPAAGDFLSKDSYTTTPLQPQSEIGSWVVVDTKAAAGTVINENKLKMFLSSIFTFQKDGFMSFIFKGNEMKSEYEIDPDSNELISKYSSGKTERQFTIIEISQEHMIMKNQKHGFYFYLKRR